MGKPATSYLCTQHQPGPQLHETASWLLHFALGFFGLLYFALPSRPPLQADAQSAVALKVQAGLSSRKCALLPNLPPRRLFNRKLHLFGRRLLESEVLPALNGQLYLGGRQEEVQTINTKYENKLEWAVPALKKREKKKRKEK